MPIRILIVIPILYFLALAQSSFLPHFNFLSQAPSMIFILVVFLVFLVPSLGFASAIFGGLFLDIFSTHFLGFNVLVLLGAAFFIRFILKRYVQIPVG